MPISSYLLHQINNEAITKLNTQTIEVLKKYKIWQRTPLEKITRIRERRRFRDKRPIKYADRLPKITNLNARSLTIDTKNIGSRLNTNKVEMINQLLQDGEIDIACITETWLNESKKALITSMLDKNYHIFSNERVDKRAGGTMIMINKTYSEHCVHVTTTKMNPLSHTEITLVKMRPKRLPRGYGSLIVASIYIPPEEAIINNTNKYSGLEINEIIEHITKTQDHARSTQKQLLIICGDFNGAKSNRLCTSLDVKQINTVPTRKGRLLDPIFTNAPECYTCKNVAEFISDHDAVIATPLAKHYKNILPGKQYINSRTGKISDTVEQLEYIEWSALINIEAYDHPSYQAKFDIFYDTVHQIQDTCQPTTTTVLRNDQPWMTPFIKEQILQRNKLYRQNKMDEYKSMAKTVSNHIKRRQQIYYKRLSNKDGKKFWGIVNDTRGTGKCKTKKECRVTPDEFSKYCRSQ